MDLIILSRTYDQLYDEGTECWMNGSDNIADEYEIENAKQKLAVLLVKTLKNRKRGKSHKGIIMVIVSA